MKKIIDCLAILFMPEIWIQNKKYDKKHDEFVNKLLDYPIEELTYYTLKINGVTLWIGNMPYDCLTFYETFGYKSNFRTSRFTILKAIRKIKEAKSKRLDEERKNLDSFIKEKNHYIYNS